MTSNILKTIGARNDALEDRQINDFYATEPKAVELLLEKECFSKKILEPACGMGHISNVLKHHGYDVYSYDIINRGYGKTEDFDEETPWGNYDTLDYKKFIFDILFDESIEIVKVPWKPKLEDVFYYIDADNGDVLKKEFDIEDKAYFLIGNCFKTEAEAQANKWKVVQILSREKPLINLEEW